LCPASAHPRRWPGRRLPVRSAHPMYRHRSERNPPEHLLGGLGLRDPTAESCSFRSAHSSRNFCSLGGSSASDRGLSRLGLKSTTQTSRNCNQPHQRGQSCKERRQCDEDHRRLLATVGSTRMLDPLVRIRNTCSLATARGGSPRSRKSRQPGSPPAPVVGLPKTPTPVQARTEPGRRNYSTPCSASQRSASIAAMQPVPAAVTA